MSLKKFAKDTAIYGLATVLPRVISVLLVRLFTSEMNTGQFSEATDFWVFAAFFNVILTYGMETSFFRFYTKEQNQKKVLNTSFTMILVTSIAFLVLMLILRNPIAHFFGIKTIYFSILAWVTILDTIVVIPFAYLRVMNRPVRYAYYRVLNILVYLMIILLCFKFIPFDNFSNNEHSDLLKLFITPENRVIYIFIANLASSFLTFILFYKLYFSLNYKIEKTILRQMLMYGYPIMIAGIAYVVNENLDKLLLKRMLSPQIMGSYAATYKIGTFMSLYITAFRLGAEPFFFSQSKELDAKEKYAKIMYYFTVVGVIFYIFIMANLKLINTFFIRQDEYFQTINIIPIILAANLMLGIYHNLSVWYKLTDKTKFGMYFSIFGAILTIILNIYLIPKFQYMASAWITYIAYGSMAVISYIYGMKYYNVPYKTYKILSYIIISYILAYFMMRYYDNYLLNYSLLIVFLTVIYFLEFKGGKLTYKKG